jgi:hypothetical protein
MVNYKNVPGKKNAGVVHPGHPAIIDTGLLADKTAKYKAGTILAFNEEGLLIAAREAEEAGEEEEGVEETYPVGVLTADSDGVNAEVLVLWHGMVVQGRLLDSSGDAPVAADDTLAFGLRAAGIYPIQPWAKIDKR